MNAQIKNIHICSDCEAQDIGSKHFLPIGWQIVERDNGEALICGDCNQITNLFEKPVNDDAKNDLGIMAISMPTSQIIALYFGNIPINLSLEQSEAIVTELSQCITILRGEHPSQRGA